MWDFRKELKISPNVDCNKKPGEIGSCSQNVKRE